MKEGKRNKKVTVTIKNMWFPYQCVYLFIYLRTQATIK